MKRPLDMSASKVSRSMFISDPGDRCLWRVQMPGGGISRWEMDGTPGNLSITSSDELIVDVRREDRYYQDIFSCLDVTRTQSIPLPTEIDDVRHAVQSSNGNIIRAGLTQWGARGTLKGRPCIMSHGPTTRPYHSYPSPSPSSNITYKYSYTSIYWLSRSVVLELFWIIDRPMLFADHQLEMQNFSWQYRIKYDGK